jgi:hypothetical protein
MQVSVKVERPDPNKLQKEWGLAAGGLGGGSNGAAYGAIIDVGGINNVHYLANHDKNHWDVKKLAEVAKIPNSFLLGAGASSDCCELIPNTSFVDGSQPTCRTHTAHVDPATGAGILKKHDVDPSYRSLVNMYASLGQECDALSVHVSEAINEKQSLVSAMRTVIREHYKAEDGKNVALGGAFRVLKGAIKSHIMPGYSKIDMHTMEQVNDWLVFYQPIEAPLTCCSVQVAHDIPGLELRVEHTHFFGETVGGHYHYDVTPSEIEYQGYFVPASKLYRVDQSIEPKQN